MTSFTSRLRFAVPFAALCLFGAGCVGTTAAPTGPDGGIWKTTDGGQHWVNKKVLVVGAKVTGAVAGYSISSLIFDPQDHATMYAATIGNGIIYSQDGGDSWQQPKLLTVGTINAIAVDPKNKCTVYASLANKLYKTTDCGRDWDQIFFDPRTNKAFTKLVIDWYNPTQLFAGTNDGDIYLSKDSGLSWRVVKRVDGVAITDMLIDAKDSRTVYVGTQGDGIWKTMDDGETWYQIKKQFGDEYRDARTVIRLVMDPLDSQILFNISKYGIIKSTDGGQTWTALNLTAPPGTVKINALAIDPKNDKNIVYTGVSTLQFTTDGGVSWTPKKLPTSQVGSTLLIDPVDSNTMYLGTTAPPQTKSGILF